MPDGRALQSDSPVVQPDQARGAAARGGGEDVKLERSPGLNLVRAERSNCCIYAFVEKHPVEKVNKLDELIGHTSGFCINSVASVANACIPDNYLKERL